MKSKLKEKDKIKIRELLLKNYPTFKIHKLTRASYSQILREQNFIKARKNMIKQFFAGKVDISPKGDYVDVTE